MDIIDSTTRFAQLEGRPDPGAETSAISGGSATSGGGDLELSGLWPAAIGRLAERISPQNFDMWLRPVEAVDFDGHVLRLRAPNSYVRLWFESNYVEAVVSELRELRPLGEIRIEFAADAATGPVIHAEEPVVVQEPMAPASPAADPSSPGPNPNPNPTTTTTTITISGGDPGRMATREMGAILNPRYTFDTFVAGPSNQLAVSASQAAGNTLRPQYNPVFIYGGAGLGKTHLLHAIGNQHRRLRPDARILYLSSERFMNEYITAIRTGAMHDFRRRYRDGIDMLLIDDVQFLAGKDGTQEEFFHTFNALHDASKQIVLTADRKPYEIPDVADRLKTRFAWGLLADVTPPELEVRIAILRKKAMSENLELPDDVALYIASTVKSNVRELEGALIRLAAVASLGHRAIDLEFAQEALGAAITRPREIITCDAIIRAVATYYGVRPSDIKSDRRHKSISTPRAIAMYLARQHTKDSYPDLGRGFGGKHHTTVISAVEKIAERSKTDPTLRSEISAIEATIRR